MSLSGQDPSAALCKTTSSLNTKPTGKLSLICESSSIPKTDRFYNHITTVCQHAIPYMSLCGNFWTCPLHLLPLARFVFPTIWCDASVDIWENSKMCHWTIISAFATFMFYNTRIVISFTFVQFCILSRFQKMNLSVHDCLNEILKFWTNFLCLHKANVEWSKYLIIICVVRLNSLNLIGSWSFAFECVVDGKMSEYCGLYYAAQQKAEDGKSFGSSTVWTSR